MATLSSDITLLVILTLVFTTYIFKDLVLSLTIDLTSKYSSCQHLFIDILEYLFHKHNYFDRINKQTLWYNCLCGHFKFWYSCPTWIPLCFFLLNQIYWWVFCLHLLCSLYKRLLQFLLFLLVSNNFFIDWLSILEHLLFSNLVPSDSHVDIHCMNWWICNLGFYRILFLYSLHFCS